MAITNETPTTTDSDRLTVQQQFQRIREAKGISRNKIDVGAGIARGYTLLFERGSVSPTLDTLNRMVALLGAELTLTQS